MEEATCVIRKTGGQCNTTELTATCCKKRDQCGDVSEIEVKAKISTRPNEMDRPLFRVNKGSPRRRFRSRANRIISNNDKTIKLLRKLRDELSTIREPTSGTKGGLGQPADEQDIKPVSVEEKENMSAEDHSGSVPEFVYPDETIQHVPVCSDLLPVRMDSGISSDQIQHCFALRSSFSRGKSIEGEYPDRTDPKGGEVSTELAETRWNFDQENPQQSVGNPDQSSTSPAGERRSAEESSVQRFETLLEKTRKNLDHQKQTIPAGNFNQTSIRTVGEVRSTTPPNLFSVFLDGSSLQMCRSQFETVDHGDRKTVTMCFDSALPRWKLEEKLATNRTQSILAGIGFEKEAATLANERLGCSWNVTVREVAGGPSSWEQGGNSQLNICSLRPHRELLIYYTKLVVELRSVDACLSVLLQFMTPFLPSNGALEMAQRLQGADRYLTIVEAELRAYCDQVRKAEELTYRPSVMSLNEMSLAMLDNVSLYLCNVLRVFLIFLSQIRVNVKLLSSKSHCYLFLSLLSDLLITLHPTTTIMAINVQIEGKNLDHEAKINDKSRSINMEILQLLQNIEKQVVHTELWLRHLCQGLTLQPQRSVPPTVVRTAAAASGGDTACVFSCATQTDHTASRQPDGPAEHRSRDKSEDNAKPLQKTSTNILNTVLRGKFQRGGYVVNSGPTEGYSWRIDALDSARVSDTKGLD